MSISTIQINDKKNEIIEELTQMGVEPNNYEVNKRLTEYFDKHTFGMPVYSPIEQVAYEESSKDDYNHNFFTFNEDINTLFKADTELNNKVVAIQEYYDREKNKIINSLANLYLKVQNLEDALKNTSRVQQYTESFDDMYNIEFYGNADRNIPVTTAFVDLLQKKIYTDKTKAQLNRISIPNAKITIDGLHNFNHVDQNGSIKNVLSDIISENCILSCKSNNSTQKELSIVVDLGEIITFNSVIFRFTTTREMKCTLALSDDGLNYTDAYDLIGTEMLEWNFNQQQKRYLKITCLKDEPDGISDLNDREVYDYYYIFKNVFVLNDKYNPKSVFVSKRITFNNLTNTIKLDVDDLIFANTRIDYFIGFDNGMNKVGWDVIDNHKDLKLFMFEKLSKIANVYLSEFGSTDGIIDAYSVYELPKNVNYNSIKVIPGYNRWSVARYNRNNGDSDDGFNLYTSDFSDFVDMCSKTDLFMDCENYDTFQIQTNVLYTFTQYVVLDVSNNLYNNFIKVMDDNTCSTEFTNAQIRLFVNGYEITTGDTKEYSFALKTGTNKIQFAVYCPSPSITNKTLYHNLNAKVLTNDVFAMPPMRYTSNTVLDKVLSDNYDYYTIKDRKIYVKCDPKDMIHSSLEDMGYFITFSALRPDMADYFDEDKLSFRIMAILNSDNENVSPRISSFRITGR